MYQFSATKPTPTMESVWIQRWVLILGSYNYEILYKQGSQQVNANGVVGYHHQSVSNLQVITIPGEKILVMEHLDTMPVSA